MKVRNEAKHKSIDFGFFPFSGAPKSVWGCKERLFSPFLRILNENSETIPNEIKKKTHIFDLCRFGNLEQSKKHWFKLPIATRYIAALDFGRQIKKKI